MEATLRFGVLTLSDRSSRGDRPDASGPALVSKIEQHGWQVERQEIIPDDHASIVKILTSWSDAGDVDVVLTTGGTGFSPRDVTPEATLEVVERQAPGIAEAMRIASLKITPHAMLSRGTAGIRGRTLIINLPGSPKGALENLDVVLPVLQHAVQLLRNDPSAEKSHSSSILTDLPKRPVSGENNGFSA